MGVIFGARALDCMERGGLGFRPTPGAHVFDRLGIAVARTETIGPEDDYKDFAYRMDVWRPGESDFDSCAAGRSTLDHKGEQATTDGGSRVSDALPVAASYQTKDSNFFGPVLCSTSPDPVILQPGDGAYVPVALSRAVGRKSLGADQDRGRDFTLLSSLWPYPPLKARR